jgi:hypothetical protein
MRLRTGWPSLLLPTLLCSGGALAKKDKPSVNLLSFDFIPYNVQYFDDSNVLLFEDVLTHVLYRSDDAGVSWAKVPGLPEGIMMELSMHPYDNKRAYMITDAKSHWLTRDRGQTWEEFNTDALASIFRAPLAYHAGDPDRIIFNGMDCTGVFCEELVRLFVSVRLDG